MKDRIVFSTDPDYSTNEENDIEITIEPASQNLRIWLEKRPGNKIVSIIRDFEGPTDELKKLEKMLKKKCGVGGTVKNKELIIQTKDRQKLLQILNDLGYFAKLSGG
ncbi:MAG: translation initiation factor [Candidatus Marinimicrobia bacterium]|nr:translation initiation factor [Candidatus Neomarinimicrobiota bacterium]